MPTRLLCLIALCLTMEVSAAAYYRDPDLRADTLVFTAEGDLWLSSAGGGDARRLTTHPAEETQARLSPDGRYVAFAATYDERPQLYVIPVSGGLAKQLTFENGRLKVHGWTPDGRVLYSTDGRVGPIFSYQLRAVDPTTLENRALPVADAVEGVLDERGENLYFVQFGMQVSGDNVRAYRGGAKGILWRYALGSDDEAQRLLADHKGSIRRPMLDGATLYFISDASGAENLWAMDISGGPPRQVTKHRQFSVRGIDIDDNRAVYQLGADLQFLDLATNSMSTLTLQLTSDFPALRSRWLESPLEFATSFRLAGAGTRLAVTARGRAALARTDRSRLVEVNLPEESRIRKATLGPDGDWVYGFSDSSGELELWRFAADGSPRAEQLTRDGSCFRWNFALSPDGRRIAHDDNNGDLWLLDMESGENRKIVSGAAGLGPYDNLVWSGDSRLLAISHTPRDQQRARLSLYSVDRQAHQLLSSERYASNSPAFSADGKWLYFLSERKFTAFPGSPWGDRNMGVGFDRRSQIFAYGLTSDAQFPFADRTELSPREDKDEDSSEQEEDTPPPQIDWDGIADRLWPVPIPAGNYSNLAANDKYLYVLNLERGPDTVTNLLSIAIEPEPGHELFAEQVEEFGLSADGSKLFLRQQDDSNARLFIVDAAEKLPEDLADTQVQTDGWRLRLEPQQEWRQMFHDAWLMHRDSFYDPDMRGLDWVALEAKYRPLLDRLADRRDLDDLLQQMMGELGALHSSVGRGDYRKDANAPGFASLGARFIQRDKGVAIEHIFRHDPELPHTAAPLARPGVDAQTGDLLLAINGRPVTTPAGVGAALRNQAGKQLLLTLLRGRQEYQVVVVAADARTARRLQYRDWVIGKQQRVQGGNADIGYLHLHSMVSSDLGSFARDFYAHSRKQGLIIDVRRNGGGNVDSVLLEKLMRRAWSFWQNRNPAAPYTNMQDAFRGHLVVLADQFTYSDGETFTAGVQALGLAPVIGKQTAGAGVWLRGLNRLVDKGLARVPEFPVYAMDGRWINEGTGVAPTIEIDNLPHATFAGADAQLDAAIAYLERKIREEPVMPLKPRPFPPGTAPADELRGR